MRYAKILFAAALLSALSAPAFAAWQDRVNGYDRIRLSRLEESRQAGLFAASRGPGADQDTIRPVVEPPSGPISAQALTGDWQCRQMKLGGLTPTKVYSWFRCRVRQTPYGLYFEKYTGSERYAGYLDAYEGGRFGLMAAIMVGDEPSKPYSGGNEAEGAIASSSDAIGVVSSMGPGRVRIEFPFPVIESYFDVIEMRRGR